MKIMKKTLSKQQAAALALEYDDMKTAIPLIRSQIQDKINFLSVTDEPQEKDIKDLETALQCVKEQVSFYSDAFRSYSRRNGKLKEESPENLEKYTAIRQQAETVLSDFEAMESSTLRRIRMKQMAQGFFLPSQPEPEPQQSPQSPVQQPEQPKNVPLNPAAEMV